MSKKYSKIIAFVLSIVFIFGSLSVLASAEDTKLNYVVLGDSIGWGAGVINSSEACYGRIVADTNGYNFTNDAVNGHSTTNMISRLGQDKVKADVAAADIISISIGGNDFLQSNMLQLLIQGGVMNDYSQFDKVGENYYNNIGKIIDIIKGLNPDATILFQTLYNPRFDLARSVYQQGVNRINDSVKKYLSENEGAYIIVDVETYLNGKFDCFAADGIHPSAKGNVEIAKLLLSTLKELGLGTSTQPVINAEGVDTVGFGIKYVIAMAKFIVRLVMKTIGI